MGELMTDQNYRKGLQVVACQHPDPEMRASARAELEEIELREQALAEAPLAQLRAAALVLAESVKPALESVVAWVDRSLRR